MKSIERVAKRAIKQDAKVRAAVADGQTTTGRTLTTDSFQNFIGALGMGTENILSASTYGFNPISRIRTLLEWIHRGSWLGGVAIDLVADDMTRMGVEIKGDLDPGDIDELQEEFTGMGNWAKINENFKWARLYGGSLAVMLIDGQKMDTPLRLETVGKGQYKGLLVLDRWMCDPSLNDLVTELGPHLGMPKFYRVTSEAPALVGQRIHYSRALRAEGVRLPYWQRVMENLWGISVLERLYDRMVAFDSATQGASQLAYKSYLRTYGVENLREIIAAGGKAFDALLKQIQFMRTTQSNEGITLLDMKDKFEALANAPFSGLNELLMQLGQQLSGALQIPLVRLFGQSPAGFSTGETDLRAYYDTINQQQNQHKSPITSMYRAQAQSMGMKLPKGFSIAFRPLWQLTEEQKGTVATSTTDAIMKVSDAGLISDQVTLKELKQASNITGVFTNITKEDIEAAADVPVPKISETPGEAGGEGGTGTAEEPGPGESKGKEKSGPGSTDAAAIHKKKVTADGDRTLAGRIKWHDRDIAIEQRNGEARRGVDHGGKPFAVRMAADYGFIDGTVGADGEEVDCFIGPDPNADEVYVIHALKAPGFTEYDEDKCMLDFASLAHAKSCFSQSYDDIRHMGKIETFTVDEFIRLLEHFRGPITRDIETWM